MRSKVLVQMRDASIRPHLPRNSHALRAPAGAVHNLDWTLREGEHWLVTGPNGCGKSTFARSLLGKATVTGGVFESFVQRPTLVSFVDHERVSSSTNFFLSHGADLKEEGLTVGSFLLPREGQVTFEIPAEFIDTRGMSDRSLASLSSGELRRMCLARALQSGSDLLVLDEPFDFLDDSRRAVLAEMLNRYAEENGAVSSMVLISHRPEDMSLVRFLTDHLRLAASGVAASIGRLAGTTISRSNVESPNKVAAINHAAVHDLVSRTFVEHTQQALGSPAIELKEVDVRFYLEGPSVLQVTNLRVMPGEFVLLRGPSGAGKSLLLSILAGEHPQAYSSEVRVFGSALGQEETLEQRRACVSLFSPAKSQSLFTSNPFISALDVVLSGLEAKARTEQSANELSSLGGETNSPTDQDDAKRRKLATEWLRLVLPSVAPEKPYLRLSQGQRARVLLARTLALGPRLLLLDEPFAGLDEGTRGLLERIVEAILHTNPGCSVLATSHYTGDFPNATRNIVLAPVSSNNETYRLDERAA